jgi:hypothetical protein
MTRQEAIDRLKTEVKRIEEIMENGDCGCVDTDTWNEFAKKAEWRETLIELLSVPTPDPITGLVPCGCGGKVDVAFYPGWHGVPDVYHVDCFNCHVGTRPCQTAEQAKAAWNTAMGWKGGAE